MLTERAKEQMKKVDDYKKANPDATNEKAFKETGVSASSYSVWRAKANKSKKIAKKEKSKKMQLQEFVIPHSEPSKMKFICLIGDPADVMKALGELK